MLSLAQWDVPLEVQQVLDCAGLCPDALSSNKMAAVLADVRHIRDILVRFRQLAVDRTEFACLKAVAIFRPGTLIHRGTLQTVYQIVKHTRTHTHISLKHH